MQLSKNDSTYIKGLAIILIAFHNFLHLLPPKYPCNEFYFYSRNIYIILANLSLKESINILFSFVGYTGIYIFFFLSGYGLTKQIEKKQNNPQYYAIKRISRLWFLLFVGVIWYIIINIGDVNYSHILYKLTLTDNFSLARVNNISIPWWFLSCLTQLYLLFYPLYLFIKSNKYNIFIVLYAYG